MAHDRGEPLACIQHFCLHIFSSEFEFLKISLSILKCLINYFLMFKLSLYLLQECCNKINIHKYRHNWRLIYIVKLKWKEYLHLNMYNNINKYSMQSLNTQPYSQQYRQWNYTCQQLCYYALYDKKLFFVEIDEQYAVHHRISYGTKNMINTTISAQPFQKNSSFSIIFCLLHINKNRY